MHERNAHNFPLDLAVTAPVIVGYYINKIIKLWLNHSFII
jgi:hypothetical protein